MNPSFLAWSLGLAVALSGAAMASPIPYSTNANAGSYATDDPVANVVAGPGLITSLGREPGFPDAFDQLQMQSVTGSIPGDGLYLLNTFDFTVGYNRWSPAGPFHYTFSEPLTIGSVTHLIDIPFTVSISSADTLTFNASDPFYDLGIITLNIESLPLTPIVNGGGTFHGAIYAQVSGVPEPSTIALVLAVLLGSVCAFTFRRTASPRLPF